MNTELNIRDESSLPDRDKEIYEILERIWKSEEWTDLSNTEEIAQMIKQVNESIRFKNNRYEVSLSWIKVGKFDNNRTTALVRLRRQTARLKAEGKYDESKNAFMQLVKDGDMELVIKDDPTDSYYIPHNGVWKESSATTKLRIVLDASSHQKGEDPLKNRVTKEANLNPKIFNLLTKFCIGKYGVIADMKQTF